MRAFLALVIGGFIWVGCVSTSPAPTNTTQPPTPLAAQDVISALTSTIEPTNPAPPTKTLQRRNTPTHTAAPSETPMQPSSTSLIRPGAQTDLPLALNNTWVYQATRYDAVPITEFITTTHIVTLIVVDVKSTASYFAAKIRQDKSAEIPVFVAKSRQGEPLQPAQSSEYWLVVQDNRIYRQEGNPDLSNLRDRDSLEFAFPFELGDKWIWLPARLPTDPDQVNGVLRQVMQAGTVQVPAGRFDNCFLIRDAWTTDTVVNWFCPGVGWVDLKADHNGTPYGYHQVLLAYHLSAPTPAGASPTVESESRLNARTVVERFMQARIERDEASVLNLLTDRLRSEVVSKPIEAPLLQVSNPCWYRFEILRPNQPSPTQVQARVRVYEHWWPGDNAGGPPRSWEQEITLVETSAGWRVDEMGAAENEREEPTELHGPTLSACNASAVTPTPAKKGATVTGRVVAGYGGHQPIDSLPLWIGKESQGDPVARTNSSGEFTITNLPTGLVDIVDDHLRFQVPVNAPGANINLGLLKYPLIHPPTFYYSTPPPLPDPSRLLSEGQAVSFSICQTDEKWIRPPEVMQREGVWSEPPFRDRTEKFLRWWFEQPGLIYDTVGVFQQSFPDGPNLDALAADLRYLLGMWTGKALSHSKCEYDAQALDALLNRQQIEVWLLGYRAVQVRSLEIEAMPFPTPSRADTIASGVHSAIQVTPANGFQIIRFAGNGGVIAAHIISSDTKVIELPKFCRGDSTPDCTR